MKFTIPINRNTDAGNLSPRVGLFTELRWKSDNTTVVSEGTELTNDIGVYEFDVTGEDLNKALVLFVSENENAEKSELEWWGGTDGKVLFTGNPNLVYFAVGTQTGTGAPAMSNIEINLLSGTLVPTFDSTGTFRFTLAGAFNTHTYVELFHAQGNSNGRELTGYYANPNAILVESRVAGTLTNTVGAFVIKIWQF